MKAYLLVALGIGYLWVIADAVKYELHCRKRIKQLEDEKVKK